MFAGNSGLQRIKRQPLSIRHCPGRVAAEARCRLVRRQPSSRRLLERSRTDIRIADRDSESAGRRVVADEALIVDAVAFQHPGLCAVPKAPANRKRYRPCAVAYGIRALTVLSLDDVAVTVILKRQSGMCTAHGIRARQLQRASHGTPRLRLCLSAMATRTARGRTLRMLLRRQDAPCSEQKNQACCKSTKDAQRHAVSFAGIALV